MTVDIKKHEMLAQVIENRMTIQDDNTSRFFRKPILFYYRWSYRPLDGLGVRCQYLFAPVSEARLLPLTPERSDNSCET